MKSIILEILVLIIVATSRSSAHLNRGLPLDNEVSSRIINGELAADGQFPYQVRLLIYASLNCTFARFICGGSIFAKNWVMTAGHCTRAPSDENLQFLGWRIEAGEILANEPRQRRIVLLDGAYPHPKYNSTTLEYDIGLLHTAVPFDFTTPYVQPIHLVAANVNKASYVGKVVTASGFGALSSDGPASDQLYYTNLTVVDFNQCDAKFVALGDGHIPTTCFCAENVIYNSSTCFGDSGGPITLRKNGGKLIQIGLVSFGGAICNEAPNGFTDVTEFIPWIHKTMYTVKY